MADGFLGRWSRRKQEVREGKPVEDPPTPARPQPLAPATASSPPPTVAGVAAAAPLAPGAVGGGPTAPEGAAPEQAPPPPTLADAQALTPASDFKAFVARDVLPEVRNLAMKKLFADPHFNVMDGLDIYIDDYTQPDPLPEGMLRKMASAHAMGFFDHEKQADAGAVPGAPAHSAVAEAQAGADAGAGAVTDAGAIAPAIAQPRDDAEGKTPADVAQSGVCNAVPSVPFSELEVAPRAGKDAAAMPASHTEHDHDAHLRLQPDDAPQRKGVGRGTA